MTSHLSSSRNIIVYLMALVYLSMHFFVSTSSILSTADQINENSSNNNDKNFNNFNSNNNNNKMYLNVNNNNNKKNLKSRFKRNVQQKTEPRLVFSSSAWTKRQIKIDKPSQQQQQQQQQQHAQEQAYTLNNKTRKYFSQILQDKILEKMLSKPSSSESGLDLSRNGIFVEAGAFDGETWSNTLRMEKYLNWSGLVIEPSALNYKTLLSKHRSRAWSINSCLSSSPRTSSNGKIGEEEETYYEAGPFGITSSSSSKNKKKKKEQKNRKLNNAKNEQEVVYQVVCHPLSKMLDTFFAAATTATNNRRSRLSGTLRTVDYLSLDIEGSERAVLEQFPWHDRARHAVNLLTVEYNQNEELYEWMCAFMRRHGFVQTVIDDVWHQDVYFAHESVVDKLDLTSLTTVSQFIKKNLT